MADKEFSAFVEPDLINQGMLRSLDLTYAGKAGLAPLVVPGEDGLRFGPVGLTNYVPVESVSDLPTPAAGVITLAGNTVYRINGTIALGTDRLSIPNAGTYLLGAFGDRDIITYTGILAMVTIAPGIDFHSDNVSFVASGAGATMFERTGAGGFSMLFATLTMDGGGVQVFDITGAGVITIFRSGIIGTDATAIGKLGGDIVSLSGVQSVNFGDGITLVGAGTSFGLTRCELSMSAGGSGGGTLVNLAVSTWDLITITATQLITANALDTAIGGQVDNGNLPGAGASGEISNSRIFGPGKALVGIDADDTKWLITAVSGVRDSVILGSLSMEDNTDATVIATPGTFVKAAGTTALAQERRFDDSGGQSNMLRYIGSEPITLLIRVISNLTKMGGTEEEGQLQVFKNGSPIGTRISFSVSNKTDSAETLAVDDAAFGDEYELYLTNVDAANDITVADLLIVASEV